jgi:hypothetical protein
MRMSIARSNAMLDTFIASANNGLLRLYTGTRPAGPDTALAGNTLLGTLTLAATSFVRSDRTLTANAITADSAADATGTVTFARLFASDGTTALADFGVSTSAPAPGTELQIPSTNIDAGQILSASSLVISLPLGA